MRWKMISLKIKYKVCFNYFNIYFFRKIVKSSYIILKYFKDYLNNILILIIFNENNEYCIFY